uniref:Tetratricopeptide repeat protein 38 n=1 Tax=Rhodosorus marinus TaxID=101924 RepID=A0A7S0BG76_9RHOD|mmetsp:Transcript_13633/g.19652  ORF Transcript_13633/g.19652 Transcript_13633/m.19652 type:complete len:606 (+) Transcript_13633:91-1908(+)
MNGETRTVLPDALAAFARGEFKKTRDFLSKSEIAAAEIHDAHQLEVFNRKREYNEAVVDYYDSGMRDPQKLVEQTVLADHGEEKTLASDLAPLDHQRLSELVSTVGLIPLYNFSVILYQSHKLMNAMQVLEFLFEVVESQEGEEGLSIRICILLLDVYFRLGWLYEERANKVLGFLDSCSCLGINESTTESEKNNLNGEFRLAAPKLEEGNMAEVGVLAAPSTQQDGRFLIYVYRARFRALTDNARGFMKDAKSAVSAADEATFRPTAAALMLKAHMEKNLRKSLSHLMGATSSEGLCPLILNNLGVIHHRLGRHALSVAYLVSAQQGFDRLLQGSESDGKGKLIAPQSLPQMGQHRRPEIAYNLGVEYLLLGRYELALNMFGLCRSQYARSSAWWWLRMAECYVRLSEHMKASKFKGGLVETVLGSGRGRRAVLRPLADGESDYLYEATVYAETGRRVLRTLTNQSGIMGTLDLEVDKAIQLKRRAENRSLDAGFLGILCFASIETKRYEKVIEYSNELAQIEGLSEAGKSLAHIYVIEAATALKRSEIPLRRFEQDISATHLEQFWTNVAIAYLHQDQLVAAREARSHAWEAVGTGQNISRTI